MKEKKAPEIRFKGFTDDWEQRKLSELVERYDDPVETPHDGYIRLGIRSHAKGTFHEYVEPGHELETAQMHRVAANKLIFNITFAWEHAVAITDKNDAGKLVSHRFPQFTLLDLIRPEFLKYVILDEDFHHNLYLASPGGAGRNRVLKIDEALDYPIYYPSVDEQHKIGVFLDKLSDLITLHQRKHKKLLSVKKSMLEKMFPQNGAKVPEIRFEGFTDDWEQRKLDTITDVRDGTHDSPQYVETGHPFITSKNVKDGFINYEDIQYVSDKDYEEINKRSKVDKNDILMGMIGTIGNIALVRETPDFAIKNVALIKDIGDVYYRYLYHCLQSNSVAHQLDDNLDGGTQKFIALNKIRELVIPVPSEHEQHKIGDYMESLDNLITLHQRELDKLVNIKKSMLEKMFV